MTQLIEKSRAPYEKALAEELAVCDDTLYRRGNFNGTFDQLICNALMEGLDAPIAFSPGFRWGTSILPGQPITFEHVADQTAITYGTVTRNLLSGELIKEILEDVADNLFNPDPYYQQGGDMVRVGGLGFGFDPTAAMGSRVSDLELDGKPHFKRGGWQQGRSLRLVGINDTNCIALKIFIFRYEKALKLAGHRKAWG